MKAQFETEDIQEIAVRVAEILKPHLARSTPQEDAVLDKEGLASYLGVDVSWVNKQITLRTFPYLKVGKYTRFKKSHIDQWLETQKVHAIPELKRYQRR